MNTKPVFELHPGLDHLDSLEKNTLNNYSQGIDELVNYGTHVLSWGLDATDGGDEIIPQLMIFRNILENLDAISVLVRAGSIDPCKSLLRVVLESVLNLEFMFQGEIERNGLAFLICNYHSENKLTEKLTPGKEQFKQLRRKLRADRSLPDDMLPPTIAGLPAHRENLKNLIAHPLYEKVEAEYQRTIASGIRNPAWYQLFGGPPTIEQLAEKLSHQGFYEVLYRGWSGSIHGEDILKGKFGMEDGHFTISQIRLLTDTKTVTQFACSLGLIAYRAYISHRMPHREIDVAEWYLAFSPFYQSLL
ncbi:hypothetical protein AY601_2015 [Pedobacter cryoconitis]|uniref:Uncharacterized protein n=1 Tax=Pedobacter cryoconitis TaxID=188932 RepID=A0A127VCI5_9SPHI|nr:DUF5677 domain-containing protein [Pedobacter cryoconitis]AMP98921.1 hypothetical protein AY601_2015 [Pedobacter cryoconitis]